MITVVEHWHLSPCLKDRAFEVMQEMDLLTGPPAHRHPGWCGHATFLRSRQNPTEVLVVYPWRSSELHDDLLRDEEPLLASLNDRYCVRPREIARYDELLVDVDHDD
jgi:3-oxoacyl-[acyl-carrier protein] reductase